MVENEAQKKRKKAEERETEKKEVNFEL